MISSNTDNGLERQIGVIKVGKFIELFAASTLLLLASWSVTAGTAITGIDANALADGQVEVRIELDGVVPDNI